MLYLAKKFLTSVEGVYLVSKFFSSTSLCTLISPKANYVAYKSVAYKWYCVYLDLQNWQAQDYARFGDFTLFYSALVPRSLKILPLMMHSVDNVRIGLMCNCIGPKQYVHCKMIRYCNKSLIVTLCSGIVGVTMSDF